MANLLSIIVPSCNMAKYLPKCLGSLIGFSGLEVLVVNDGSSDDTSKIAHEIAAKYNQDNLTTFRIIDKPNGHYGSCINAGLPLATGEYVKILDADDFVNSKGLATLIDRLRQWVTDGSAPDLVLTGISEEYVTDGTSISGMPPFAEGDVGVDEYYDKRLSEAWYSAMHFMAYRRQMFEGLEYRQTEGVAHTDEEWILYPMAKVKTIQCLHCDVYHYLVGREGQSMSAAAKATGAVDKSWRKRLPKLLQEYPKYYAIGTPQFRRLLTEALFRPLRQEYTRQICAKQPAKWLDRPLCEVDAYLHRNCPEVYERLGALTRYRFLNYHWVRAWRRHHG